MFTIGDHVVYGMAGVCRITDIRKEAFGGRKAEYYVLQPVFESNSLIYAPVSGGRIPMRELVSREELFGLIHSLRESEFEWIENDKLRSEAFKEILRKGEMKEVLLMLRALYRHKFEQLQKGRKLHIADDNVMRSAESFSYSEIAYVLSLSPEDVPAFILRELYPEGTTLEMALQRKDEGK